MKSYNLRAFEDPGLQSLLEKIAFEEEFEKPKYEISLGSNPGDNFVGRIYRVMISETSKTKTTKSQSLIFKLSPLNKTHQQLMSTDLIFKIESEFYETVLPTLNNLLNAQGVLSSKIFPGTARCFLTQINGYNSDQSHVVVLEDKSAEGYVVYPGEKSSLDAEHCRFILKKLALLHATSMALGHHDPKTAERIRKLIWKDDLVFNNKNHLNYAHLVPSALNTLRTIEKYFVNDEKTYEKIRSLFQNYVNELITVNKPPPDVYAILHGDCWTNNVLFKYDEEGTLQDATLIDFQWGRIGSPAIDLSYMMFLCTTKEFRDANFDTLIQFYHEEVCIYLKNLGCDPVKVFPWPLLQEHLKNYGRMGVLLAVVVLPVILSDRSEFVLDIHSDSDRINEGFDELQRNGQEDILKRIVDVINDTCRLGYV